MKGVFVSLLILFTACKHEIIRENSTESSAIIISPTCSNCTTENICAIIDDIIVSSSTSYEICDVLPMGQGNLSQNGGCISWTSNNQNTDVKTCIIACTAGICDTTYITILNVTPGNSSTCNSDSAYFVNDILPIFTSNCAFGGCHNAETAADGVKLDNYTNIINNGKIKIGNAADSKLFKVINETDVDDVMPPPPYPKLSAAKIALIQQWINQGALNNSCVDDCNTENVSYKQYVKPTLESCVSCHNAGNAGGNIRLDNYELTKSVAMSGKLLGSISWDLGYKPMPSGGSKFDDCTIAKIKSWVEDGAKDN